MTLLYTPTQGEDSTQVETIRQIQKEIAKAAPNQVRLSVSGSSTIPLPKPVYELLQVAIGMMAEGKAITLVPVSLEVTTTQAAEILNISRPYLGKILESGAIAYHQVGSHRRILLEDLLSYKNQRDAERKEGLQKLTQLSQEYGLYDLNDE